MSHGGHVPSQEDRILALLRSNGSAWTPAPELSRISLQYCRAISTLRKRGIAIENRVEIHSGTRHGFYRLRQPADAHRRQLSNPRVEKSAAVSVDTAEPGKLFELPERHLDLG